MEFCKTKTTLKKTYSFKLHIKRFLGLNIFLDFLSFIITSKIIQFYEDVIWPTRIKKPSLIKRI